MPNPDCTRSISRTNNGKIRLPGWGWPILISLVLPTVARPIRADTNHPPPLRIERLPHGLRFGLIGERQVHPSPTLFVFQGSLESAEEEPIYTKVARILQARGFLGVVLDAPAHGEDRRPGEPPELAAWRTRLERGEDFVGAFVAHARAVLDYLIENRYTDPAKIVAAGTSRGGFLAFHFAAADARIKLVAGISPVTDLMALREFRGTLFGQQAEKLSLIELAPRLAGRPAWVSIGNHDRRVDTDQAIAFTRALVRVSAEGQGNDAVIPVELLVCPTAGHTNIDHAHELLAEWILRQLDPAQPHPTDS